MFGYSSRTTIGNNEELESDDDADDGDENVDQGGNNGLQISIVEGTSNDSKQMKAKTEIINKNFLNNSFDDQIYKQLWTETHAYR
ncbi:unnamed protein product, partial [Rotaria sp. Silwood2]